MPTQTRVFEGELKPAQVKGYVHLPFEMPAGAVRVDVEYSYSHQIDSDPILGGGNTIDLGVFDSRGIDFLRAGFRGWSGSERPSFFISQDEATPGYLAGALIPGVWHVLLGLYKIAPEGCAYRVGINVTTASAPHNAPPPSAHPADLPSSPVAHRHGKWLRGEMHCHTFHSDGDSPPETVVQRARERGLDFLAITDHNSTSCQRVLEQFHDPGLILIRGLEVTTFKGHFNMWGIDDWVDFRVTRPEEMSAAIEFAKAHGALTVCNHPKPYGPPWDYPDVENYHCIEVWNGPWYERNQDSLDFWSGRLAQGKRIVATGGSDWHNHAELQETPPRDLGTPTLWVHVPGTPGSATILEAIRQGHVALSDDPDGPLLDLCAGAPLQARGGDALKWERDTLLPVQVHCLRGAGQVLTLLDQNKILFCRELSTPYQVITAQLDTSSSLFVRGELRSDIGVTALTNPVYFENVG